MLVRALLVVLTILNLGVALWWATQPQTPAPAPLPALPAGVATLQLVPASAAVPQAASASSAPAASTAAPPPAVQAATASAADVPAASAPTADVPATSAVPATTAPAAPLPSKAPSVAAAADAEPAAAPVCLSLGPYPDRAAAETAAAALGTTAPLPRLREVGDDDATSFRVLLPTIGGEDGVKAAVDRIVAAGIRDYYPIRQGDGDAIALGQYRSREGAERRKAELARAGFNVDLIPSGGSGQSRWWLDLRTDSAAQATALRRQLGAQRQRALDCATLR